jgi:hypothetical protein
MRQLFAAAAVAVACTIASAASATTPFDPNSTDWEGCSRLVELAREELGPSRVLVVDSTRSITNDSAPPTGSSSFIQKAPSISTSSRRS